MFQTKVITQDVVIVTDSGLINEVLAAKGTDVPVLIMCINVLDTFLKSKQPKYMQFIFRDAIFFANGEAWRNHQVVLHSSFAQSRFSKLILDTFDQLTQYWSTLLKPEGPTRIDVYRQIGGYYKNLLFLHTIYSRFRALFQVMGLFAYNQNYNSIGQISEHFQDYIDLVDYISTTRTLTHVFKCDPEKIKGFAQYSGFYNKVQCIHSHFREIIDQRKRDLEEMTSEEQMEQKDVLAKILLRSEDGRVKYDKEGVASDLLSLFFAGHDTSAGSISFTLYYLAKNPQWRASLRKEARRFFALGLNPDTLMIKTIEAEMPLLTAFVMESWRMTPAAPVSIPRKVEGDNVFIGNVHIPKGTVVVASIYSAHHDPAIWGLNADTFSPIRFLKNEDPEKGIDHDVKGKLLVFGHGPRKCLGAHFATTMVYMGLAKIVSQLDFALPEGSPHAQSVRCKPFFTVLSPINLELEVSLAD